MLIACVIIYMAATVAIGVYASSRVKDSKDFMVAGRSLPSLHELCLRVRDLVRRGNSVVGFREVRS